MSTRTIFAAAFATSALAAIPATLATRGELSVEGFESFARHVQAIPEKLPALPADCVTKTDVASDETRLAVSEYRNKCDRAINISYQQHHAAYNEPAGVSVEQGSTVVAMGRRVEAHTTSGSNYAPIEPGAVFMRTETDSHVTGLPASVEVVACFAPDRPSGFVVKTCGKPPETLVDRTHGIIVPASPLFAPR